MNYRFGDTVVIGLGGSIVHPDGIDWKFLKRFKAFIAHQSRRRRFVVAVGGGRLARRVQEAAGKVHPLTNREKDWLGIYATHLNAKLVQTTLGTLADKRLIDVRGKVKKLTKPVTVACGWEPGWSTDYIAAALAKDFGTHEVIAAGKPAYIYDKNPDKFKSAKPFKTMSWKEYWNIIPHEWVSGANVPIDPVAAGFCRKQGIQNIVIDGRNIGNFKKLLDGKEFEGTIVK